MMADWLLPQLVQHGAALLGTAVVLNSVLTFAGALAFALLAARLVPSPRLAKVILLTPFLRLLWEVLCGATPDAYVLSEHAGSKGALGSFQLGLGVSAPLTPIVHADLGMRGGDRQYDYSVGDMLGHWLFRQVGSTPLLIVLGLVLAVSVLLLATRARQLVLWRARLKHAAAGAVTMEHARIAGRRVQIITRPDDSLGPFTSGVVHPRVWLPASLAGKEREAVLEHELAHVRDLDVLCFAVAGTLADLFWFVPGARYLERRLHESAEEAADARAIARGVAPEVLAHSILAQAAVPLPVAPPPRMLGSAVRLRRRLLALAPRPSESKKRSALRLVLALSFTLSALRSVFFGYS
jgi:hypothetical protein